MTKKITLQIHSQEKSWRDAAVLTFIENGQVEIEYDLDYITEFMGLRCDRSLSLSLPVEVRPYKGDVPGFVLDLLPQGEPLKRVLTRYDIKKEDNYYEILSKIPLSAPGNIRIKEPWSELDIQRQSYDHPGFPLDDIIRYERDFISYMEQHAAPIGGTSGAGGGSPKFLLRKDFENRFHAEGMLSDKKTKCAYIVKFPYTDSINSTLLNKTEKLYYDFLKTLPLNTGAAIDMHNNILFIERFDRIKTKKNVVEYYGVESFYSAHNINTYGAKLWHEDNLSLIQKYSSSPQSDMIEYLKRDLMNQILANTDNHGRNVSFLKTKNSVRLTPIYDVTAMRFFTADFIVELTEWKKEHSRLIDQVNWMSSDFKLNKKTVLNELKVLAQKLTLIEKKLEDLDVSLDFIERAAPYREKAISQMISL